MTHFPTSHSILAEFPLAQFLIEKYNFSKSTSCQLIKSWVNDTYLIEDDDKKYIFRVYRFNWRSKSEIEGELKFITFLKGKNIPVSYPIFDQQKKWVQTFSAAEGKRYGVLFSFAEGEKRMNLTPELHYKIGVVIAKIHQYSEGLQYNRIHYTPSVLLDNSFQKFRKYLSEKDLEFDFAKETKQYIYDFIKTSNQEQFRKGMVHLDIWADNINIDKDDNFAIFDFDFVAMAG